MGLPEILEAIRADAAAEAAAIEATAAREAGALRDLARCQAAEAETKAAAAVTDRSRAEASAIQDRARQEATATLRAAQAAWLADVREGAERALADARQRPDYPRTLGATLREAWAACPGPGVIRVDPRDAKPVRALVAQLGLTARVDACLRTWGGVCVASADERVVIDNTLERRLERCDGWLRLAATAELDAAEEAPP